MNDYADAAERHFLSANLLFDKCPATASHCLGIAAECVLKTLMCDLQPQEKKVSGHHLGPRLWAEFENHQTLQAHPSRVTQVQRQQSGFSNWDVHQRYLNRAEGCFSSERLIQQKNSAKSLLGLMQLVRRGLA